MVSEKKIFTCNSHYKTIADDDAPRTGPIWTPGAQLAGFIKRTTIHCCTLNMIALDIVVLEKFFFYLCLSHCKSMGANDHQGGAIFDPRGMLHRIYVKLHIIMLHTKYTNFGSCGFRDEDFFMPMADNDALGAGPVWTPGARLAGFTKGPLYIATHKI